ncbi:cyanate permease [Secundilactobacillus oryzae JCM 18671]|uniref:Cyanate permease n=1 Tax=Secundilactobacillus oryzae JCM 18671 TaxID=1291743 RepID=A0A081BIN1_9LACO|nr:MFS transporter [Secundilactobacillus oryzae]GAK47899.1 cyanate permease [Secundilactobacillus oryzae JCM 18671]
MTSKKTRLILLSVFFVAVNMRLPITAIPPLLPSLQKAIGLPSSAAGLITTIPLLTFAVISPILAKLGKRFGNERVILAFTVLLVLGSLLRVNQSMMAVMFGTFLIGLGIDSANVLLPAVIKDQIPMKPMLGVSTYTTTMLEIGALGTGLAGIIVVATNLRFAMLTLFVISLISLVGWFPMVKRQVADDEMTKQRKTEKGRSVWTSKTGWVISLFFGLQSLIYYSLLTWLPSVFVSQGFTSIQAGTFVTVMQISSLPFAFLVPLLSDKKGGDAVMVWAVGIGFVGGSLLFAIPGLNVLAVTIIAIFVGIASGIAFNLSIVYFAQKTANSVETAEVSGMAQTVGYLLAASGPIVFGYIESLLDSWTLVLLLNAVLAFILFGAGLYINRKTHIFDVAHK